MRSFDPDVIHAHEPLTPSTSMLAVLAASAPVVATFHASLDRSRLMELAEPALRQVSGGSMPGSRSRMRPLPSCVA